MKTIAINQQQQSELEQILEELIFALKQTYSNEDLLKLSSQIFGESISQTYKSKKDITVNTFKAIGKLSGNIYSFSKKNIIRYKQDGLQESFINDIDLAKNYLSNSPDKLRNFSQSIKDKSLAFKNNFLEKPKDKKIELISVGLMGLLIFYASAGGEDFEGGIPDSDLKIGIGFHRHIISHSIIMGLVVEFLMRSGIELINNMYKNLPLKHHKFWDSAHDYINKHKGIAIGSMWAGISIHLLKDSGIFGHGIKPYNGIPFELAQETHQGLFAANGTASAIFASRK
jgi:flagellin-like hook-associated protein FlgL